MEAEENENKIEKFRVDQPMQSTEMGLPVDPISLLIMGPFFLFVNTISMFQRSMMGMQNVGTIGAPPTNSGYKMVELRRDKNGNITSIMEKW